MMAVPKLIDVTATPDLLRLAQEVAQSGVPVVLRQGTAELAVLTPVAKPRRRSRQRHNPVDDTDSLLDIVGISESAEPTDVARHKDEYLAEAFESLNR